MQTEKPSKKNRRVADEDHDGEPEFVGVKRGQNYHISENHLSDMQIENSTVNRPKKKLKGRDIAEKDTDGTDGTMVSEPIGEKASDEELEWEDEYDDEFENEDKVEDKSEHSSDYEEVASDDEVANNIGRENDMEAEKTAKRVIKKEKKQSKNKVVPFVGNAKDLKPDEVLEYENRAYDMLHRGAVGYPCLSCDFLSGTKSELKVFKMPTPEQIVMQETEYPLELYAVAGSQAEKAKENRIYVMRMANLCQTKYDDDSEGPDNEQDEINEGNPIILQRSIPVRGAINRIRSMMGLPIVAVWTEARQVRIYNVQPAMEQLGAIDIQKFAKDQQLGTVAEEATLISSFQFADEGYALDWSPHRIGRLLTGDRTNQVHIIEAKDELCSKFVKSNEFYNYHQGWVEGLQFSPTESEVFATCSTDGTVQVVDMRERTFDKSQICIKAHDCDVNVISWNKLMPNLIASGGDDGAIKVWDLRFPQDLPITNIKWHTGAITSLTWHPADEWALAAAADDDKVSIWDFSVEDNEQGTTAAKEFDVPEQMTFLHQGQELIKEVRFHPRLKDVLLTTAQSGFNLFKPAINDDAASEEDSEEENRLEIIPTLN